MNIGNMAKGMNDVERFDFDCGYDGYVDDSDDGEYVRYTDYAALQQQLAAAREDVRRLNYMIANGAHVESVADGLCRLGYLATETYGPLSDTERGAIDGAMIAEQHDATLQRDRQP